MNGWIVIDYLPVARAVFIVVVDDPTSLQVRVDRYRTEIFEAALFKLLADFVRQTVADGYISVIVLVIQNRVVIGKAPQPTIKAAILLTKLSEAFCVVDDRPDFPLGANHSLGVHYALDVGFVIFGDKVILKVIKAGAENLTLFNHQIPVKSALHNLHHQKLELSSVIMQRYAPLVIVIADIQF